MRQGVALWRKTSCFKKTFGKDSTLSSHPRCGRSVGCGPLPFDVALSIAISILSLLGEQTPPPETEASLALKVGRI
jgi:hypothetical protein